MAETLLIIEDEALLGSELAELFRDQGWDVVLADTIEKGEQVLFLQGVDPLVTLSDMSLPDGNALDLLEKIRARGLGGEWIFLTAYGGVTDSVRALKLGAFDFLEKPCEQDRLELVVAGAARSARAQRRLRDEAAARTRQFSPESFAGRSPATHKVRGMLARLTQVPFSALVLTGETGTGKGLAARILHHGGPRAAGPLVQINCAALPRDLLESELFGHEAGAFTGAKGRRRGLMEQAGGGTLFLDEIGDLDLNLQAKLLKAIEDRSIRRLGGDREIGVDLQVIAATNRDLETGVREGTFRADLYHRLSVFRLDLPALRKRKDDLEDLLPVFIHEFNVKADRHVEVIPDGIWGRLRAYDWPGNVRELRNVVERCVLLADGGQFPEQWLQLGMPAGLSAPAAESEADRLCLPMDGSMGFDEMDRRIVENALGRNGYNVTSTARLFRTTREKLRYRIQKYGLQIPE